MNEKNEVEQMKELVELFKETPAYKELVEKKRQELLNQRKAWIEERDALEKKKSEVWQSYNKPLEDARAEVARLEKELEQARIKASNLWREQSRETDKINRKINALNAELVETADKTINEAIEFFKNTGERIRMLDIHTQTRLQDVNIIPDAGEKVYSIFSNSESINDAVTYCHAAVEELERLKYQAAEVSLEAIENLKKNIPDHTEIREYTQKKPMGLDRTPGIVEYVRSQARGLDQKVKRLLER